MIATYGNLHGWYFKPEDHVPRGPFKTKLDLKAGLERYFEETQKVLLMHGMEFNAFKKALSKLHRERRNLFRKLF